MSTKVSLSYWDNRTPTPEEVAFRLYESGQISHEELIRLLQDTINAVALANGYVDEYGLPCRESCERK